MILKALNNLACLPIPPIFTERIDSSYAIKDPANGLAVLLPGTNYLKDSFSYWGATAL